MIKTSANGRWTDERGNAANPSANKEEAIKQLSSLENCYRCHDCFRCKDCVECEDSGDLTNCKRCSSCYELSGEDNLYLDNDSGSRIKTNYLGSKARLGKDVKMEKHTYIDHGAAVGDFVIFGKYSRVFCDIPDAAAIPPYACVYECSVLEFRGGSFTIINRRLAVLKAEGVLLSFDPFVESSLTEALDRVKLLDYERATIVSVLESLNPCNSTTETA